MKQNVLKKLPLGVLLVASFYAFGAIVLLISAFTNPTGVRETIATAFGLSPNIGVEFVFVVAIIALVLAYGLFRRSRWGFLLAIFYSLYFCIVSLTLGGLTFAWTKNPATQIYFGNFLWSTLVIIYLVIVRRKFFGDNSAKSF
jgi:hypothetical protein